MVSDNTHYSDFMHPNVKGSVASSDSGTLKKKNSIPPEQELTCGDYINIFDDKILKPIFVYKYRIKKHQQEVDPEDILREVQHYEMDQMVIDQVALSEIGSFVDDKKSV